MNPVQFYPIQNGDLPDASAPIPISFLASRQPQVYQVVEESQKTGKFCSICNDNAMHSFYGSLSCDACRVSIRDFLK